MSVWRVVRRLGPIVVVAASATAALAAVPAPPRAAPVSMQLVRFGGGHFGASHGGGFGARPSFGRPASRFSRPSRARGILRRIGHALAFAAVLHFLFAGSHGGGLLLLLLILGLVFVLMRRRRRRRYAPY